jgi:hypothetical protein
MAVYNCSLNLSSPLISYYRQQKVDVSAPDGILLKEHTKPDLDIHISWVIHSGFYSVIFYIGSLALS